jgi:hypothetical protein
VHENINLSGLLVEVLECLLDNGLINHVCHREQDFALVFPFNILFRLLKCRFGPAQDADIRGAGFCKSFNEAHPDARPTTCHDDHFVLCGELWLVGGDGCVRFVMPRLGG